jgi:uncharacterized membrane protein YhiD involved in acid resistance
MAAAADVQNAAAKTAGQWKTWYWICFGGIVFFLLSIPLLRGRWPDLPAKAGPGRQSRARPAGLRTHRPDDMHRGPFG